jgi:release factor glutamine methyltransferase
MQNSTYTIKYLLGYTRQSLADLYPAQEAKAICHLLLENILGLTPAALYISLENTVGAAQERRLKAAVAQLRQKRPIQQVLGKAAFYGLEMRVDGHTLIPRPETEELVAWALNSRRLAAAAAGGSGRREAPALRALDIGTGSGCIAIALAKHLPDAAVHAWDASEQALDIARQNAALNGVPVYFEKKDIFQISDTEIQKFDVIVSNPPYVCESEKAHMHDNVLRYEPRAALFVQDDSPLIFYDAIAGFAQRALSDGGEVFVEINENFGRETMNVFTRSGFSPVELRRDVNGKPRMVKAKR